MRQVRYFRIYCLMTSFFSVHYSHAFLQSVGLVHKLLVDETSADLFDFDSRRFPVWPTSGQVGTVPLLLVDWGGLPPAFDRLAGHGRMQTIYWWLSVNEEGWASHHKSDTNQVA